VILKASATRRKKGPDDPYDKWLTYDGRMRAIFTVAVLGLSACTSSSSDTAAPSSTPPPVSGSCDTDPLKTNLTAQQTGVSVDAFDCPILKWTASYGEPDPMLIKAIIYTESRFDKNAVACPNLPCGTPSGWTADESGCYGLMQIVPACGGTPDKAGILPSGHPNLTKDEKSGDYAGSVFNPDVNIRIGISGLAGNRAEVVKLFPGCTTDQYTMMALGNYGNHGSTKGCTEYNKSYLDVVIEAYKQYASAAGYQAHPY
jgi:hypothetical protein